MESLQGCRGKFLLGKALGTESQMGNNDLLRSQTSSRSQRTRFHNCNHHTCWSLIRMRWHLLSFLCISIHFSTRCRIGSQSMNSNLHHIRGRRPCQSRDTCNLRCKPRKDRIPLWHQLNRHRQRGKCLGDRQWAQAPQLGSNGLLDSQHNWLRRLLLD